MLRLLETALEIGEECGKKETGFPTKEACMRAPYTGDRDCPTDKLGSVDVVRGEIRIGDC